MLSFDQRACFIAGQAKSGTTLLAALLDNHPELLVLPQETAYFPTLLKKYRDAGRRKQGFGAPMEEWFQKACAREPGDRFASAQAFMGALRVAAGLSAPIPDPSLARQQMASASELPRGPTVPTLTGPSTTGGRV